MALGIGENLIRQSVLQLMEGRAISAIVPPTAWVEPMRHRLGDCDPAACAGSFAARIGAAVIINQRYHRTDCVIGYAVHMSQVQ